MSERGSAASAEAVPVRRRHARVDHDPRPDREAPGPVGRRLPIVAKLGGVIGCFLVVLTIVAAVLLVELRSVTRSYDALDYFEKVGLPFIVAVNQFEGRPNLPLDQVRLSANVDPHVPVVAVDARDRESVKQLVLTLLDVLLARARSGHRSVDRQELVGSGEA